MKIAVSTAEDSLDSQIDPRFGRCQYFLIVDSETMDFEALSNQGAIASGVSGTVKEALERYKSGSLRQASGATAQIHAGIKGKGRGGE
jgi:predicted Fe-Mo cluster-binding NifX family protein